MAEFAIPLNPTKPDTCQKKREDQHWWICHHCGSLWSEMVSGIGWIPLSCPDRPSVKKERSQEA